MSIQLRYPLTLANGNHSSVLTFTAFEKNENQTSRTITRSAAFNANTPNVKLTNYGAITLSMPTIGETTYTQNWDTEGEGLLNQLGDIFRGQGDFSDKFADSAGKIFQSAFGSNDFLEKEKGSIVNDRVTAKYRGSELRTKSFSYQFRPRNLNELEQVAKIIFMFKFCAAPDSVTLEKGSFAEDRETYSNAGGLGNIEGTIYAGQKAISRSLKNISNFDRLRYPAVWKIQEIDRSRQNRHIPLFRFGPAVITSITVNTTPHDYWLTFKNGDPASIDFEVSFTETSVLLSSDIAGGF